MQGPATDSSEWNTRRDRQVKRQKIRAKIPWWAWNLMPSSTSDSGEWSASGEDIALREWGWGGLNYRVRVCWDGQLGDSSQCLPWSVGLSDVFRLCHVRKVLLAILSFSLFSLSQSPHFQIERLWWMCFQFIFAVLLLVVCKYIVSSFINSIIKFILSSLFVLFPSPPLPPYQYTY